MQVSTTCSWLQLARDRWRSLRGGVCGQGESGRGFKDRALCVSAPADRPDWTKMSPYATGDCIRTYWSLDSCHCTVLKLRVKVEKTTSRELSRWLTVTQGSKVQNKSRSSLPAASCWRRRGTTAGQGSLRGLLYKLWWMEAKRWDRRTLFYTCVMAQVARTIDQENTIRLSINQ